MGEQPIPSHGLLQRQVDLIRAIIAPFSETVHSVGLFGSRATGSYRPNSDIDLVLYGPVPAPVVNRIWTLFDESSLPFKVDVVAYDLIEYEPLKTHIDSVGLPLLTFE